MELKEIIERNKLSQSTDMIDMKLQHEQEIEYFKSKLEESKQVEEEKMKLISEELIEERKSSLITKKNYERQLALYIEKYDALKEEFELMRSSLAKTQTHQTKNKDEEIRFVLSLRIKHLVYCIAI